MTILILCLIACAITAAYSMMQRRDARADLIRATSEKIEARGMINQLTNPRIAPSRFFVAEGRDHWRVVAVHTSLEAYASHTIVALFRFNPDDGESKAFALSEARELIDKLYEPLNIRTY